ncbi:MAG: EF-P lysine aminoacylase GenX [Lentisphaerae bacterium]|jgi:elongation factor P--(R)-beta-lysine ligase|nr:EF-P lysine aminoacylase GenX [Lentisphaerota bacterium]MBT4818356.1 EF-P lysine aminoacylase GenX [Lentisphaerota bacterium]MBT5607917.1 EF-P lysine aminoacylase GenX [Lentisphaerota bacterium]MBT7056563.1 EF-P lysine aminoacylase GenX [Lentisphaerota bacterium]MBT7846354.1 EF-P lysine aminoacylase GenX [Lentisphaerota bacterium]
MLSAARSFFRDRGFLDVETPVRIPTPALEDYIEAEASGDHFLRTSPELHMKRLLAAGYERIYQIGTCCRLGERGRVHLPEFAMLEWYRLDADYMDVLDDTIALVRAVAASGELRFRGQLTDVRGEWQRLTVDEAFRTYAGCTPDAALSRGRFEEILVERIEPHLGGATPTVLMDYPVCTSGLSKPKAGTPGRAERWELYIGGLEIANACSELTDPAAQRRSFQATADLRRREQRPVYPVDEAFLAALGQISSAAGVAIGIDRLAMVLTGAEVIDDVVAFPADRA